MQLKFPLFLLVSIYFTTTSQTLQFDHLTIKDGLSDNSVRNILQDELGYLWFATLNGLDRYDGKNFKNYKSVAGDPHSLNNSTIIKIKEDKRGFIWCWSNDRNIQRVDPVTNKVDNLQALTPDKEINIQGIQIASNGDIWLWGKKGCIRVYYTDQKSTIQQEVFDKNNTFQNENINFVFEDSIGSIWIGTQEGLINTSLSENGNRTIATYFNNKDFLTFKKYDDEIWFGTRNKGIRKFSITNKSFDLYENINVVLANNPIRQIHKINTSHVLLGGTNFLFDLNIENNSITTVSHKKLKIITKFHTDAFQNHWLVGQDKGIFRYDEDSKKLIYYDLKANERTFFGIPDKQLFFEDSNKNLWIGIHGGGLFFYDTKRDKFENYRYDENKSNSLSSDVVLTIFEDYSKNLWVGTMHGGVNKINLTKNNFNWHQPVQQNMANLFENEIRTVADAKNGNLWMGSKGGKIFRYDKNNQLLETYPDILSNSNKNILKDINVYCLYIDEQDNLWIGTKGKGIFVFKDIINASPKNIEIIHFDIETTKSLDKIYAITQDKHGNYWIGSHKHGLTQLSTPFDNPSFSFYKNKEGPDQLISDFVRYLFFDMDSNLWIGTSDGISILPASQLKQDTKKFVSSVNDKQNISSLSYNKVDCIFQAKDKTMYVATMGGGVNILKNFDLDKGSFEWEHLNKSDGLTTNKIFSIQEDIQKNIWLSTSLGINKYNPHTRKNEVFFVEREQGLNYFSEGCGLKTNTGELIFGHNRGFLRFNPKSIIKDTTQYPVVLSGIYVNGNEVNPSDSGLIKKPINYENEIQLTHLQNSIRFDFSVLDYKDPKKIQFTYKLDGFDKNWSTPLTKNTAIYQNLPPGDYLFLLKASNSDGIEMKETLKFDITIRPPFFKSIFGYLLLILIVAGVIFVFLYQYNKQISAKHKVELADTLNEKKLKYYTNISHEFKTPLTLILGPVEDILEEKELSEEVLQSARHIKKNANYLFNLVEQILDFRKINEGKMKLNVSNIDIVSFIQNVHTEFLPLANKEEIELTLHTQSQSILGYIDVRLIKKAVYNLISNAIKFTPAYKSIEIVVGIDKETNMLTIRVSDEGCGIRKKELKQLFERFYRSENSSGIGLFYVRELVNSHKGKVDVESVYGEGSSFTISLPIDKSAYLEDEIREDAATIQVTPAATVSFDELETESDNKHDATLLIIEDNEEMRNYLSRKFEPFFNVLTAENGKTGLALAIAKIPDIIVCDLMMPVMDGIETIKNLRENFNTSHLPIILLTANSSEQKKIEGLETGANDYITKPFNFKYIKLKIDNIISQRKKIIENFSLDPELPVNVLSNSEQDNLFLEKVKDFIEKNIGKHDFNVDSLSSEMGFSRTIFYKKMKSVSGVTPLGFINTIQMKKAALLLKKTPHTITDISIMVGFNDTNYFSKSFKKHFGKTPKSYQIENRTS